MGLVFLVDQVDQYYRLVRVDQHYPGHLLHLELLYYLLGLVDRVGLVFLVDLMDQ